MCSKASSKYEFERNYIRGHLFKSRGRTCGLRHKSHKLIPKGAGVRLPSPPLTHFPNVEEWCCFVCTYELYAEWSTTQSRSGHMEK